MLFAILNDFIGSEGKSAREVHDFIIQSVPNNLKDFSELKSLENLKKIKEVQNQIQVGQVNIDKFMMLIEQFNAMSNAIDNIDVNTIRQNLGLP